MRVYVTGADGMLGTALLAALRDHHATADWPVLGVSLRDFDIADAAAVSASIDAFRPDVVVHAAALAIVDECEVDPRRAGRINVGGTHNVVAASRRHDSRLVYISSDYVFDGRARPVGGYREDDVPNPLSVYGLTKLAGERIATTCPRSLVVRTSWLFGGRDERTDNVLAMVRRARHGRTTGLIADQFSCPTYTVDLARAVVHLLVEAPDLVGTVHVANTGSASWYQVGETVLAALAGSDRNTRGMPKPTRARMADCGFVGERPRDSTLSTERLAALGHAMPGWADAVERFCTRLVATPDSAGAQAQPVTAHAS